MQCGGGREGSGGGVLQKLRRCVCSVLIISLRNEISRPRWLNRTTIYHLHRPIACSLQTPGSWELLEFDHACRAASLAVEERKVHVSPEPGYVFLFLSFAPFTLSTVCFAFWGDVEVEDRVPGTPG